MACDGCKKKDDIYKHSYHGRKNIEGKFVCDFCGAVDGSDKAKKICPCCDNLLTEESKTAIYFVEMEKTIKELRLENKKASLLVTNVIGKVLIKYVPEEERQKVIDDINKSTLEDINIFLGSDKKKERK